MKCDADLIVIGCGAAGLATSIFAARTDPACRLICLDGARHIGAKILISGGSRCNVTNSEVSERDFWGGDSRFVRSVLRAFPASRTVEFFRHIGVALHAEDDGKLFPDSQTSRTVLQALTREADRLEIAIAAGDRVCDVRRDRDHFVTTTASGRLLTSTMVALATGGRSLPKSGSDGFGYELAARLGHNCVHTTPALAPLVFEGWESLAGVAQQAAMTLRADGHHVLTLQGSLLWTHFGASGPLALNMSRHWHDAHDQGRSIEVTLNLCPRETFEKLDAWLREHEHGRPRARVATIVATRLPAAVAERWVRAAGITPDQTMAHLPRPQRHRLVRDLMHTQLPVVASRGYAYAEVTAGGIPLNEVDHTSMQSRLCPGLYFAGEILDVDGRLGGFNFQWAWSSAWVAGRAIARAVRGSDGR